MVMPVPSNAWLAMSAREPEGAEPWRQGTPLTNINTVHADWCGPCRAIAPIYEQLSASLSRPNVVTFVKINTDEQKSIATAYQISSLPTFMVFKEGKTVEKVQGADPKKLQAIVKKLASEVNNMTSENSEGPQWRGAELPRGYHDITDQIELRGCELLNADDDCGPVRVLFDRSKPKALNSNNADSKDWVESGADDQLLLFSPFQSMLKLHTLQASLHVYFSRRTDS